MDDLISRQAAIDALGEEPLVWMEKEDEYGQGLNNQWHYDVNALKAVPSAQQWIPYNERLPEEGKEVLISTNGSIYTSEYDMIDGRPFWYDTVEYRRLLGVDAWMPLPEAYKGEGNG